MQSPGTHLATQHPKYIILIITVITTQQPSVREMLPLSDGLWQLQQFLWLRDIFCILAPNKCTKENTTHTITCGQLRKGASHVQ